MTCPVVVVRGHHDRICPADWAATVAGLGAPGSAAVSLTGGGHMVPLTHGADLATVLRRWMV